MAPSGLTSFRNAGLGGPAVKTELYDAMQCRFASSGVAVECRREAAELPYCPDGKGWTGFVPVDLRDILGFHLTFSLEYCFRMQRTLFTLY